MRIRYQAVPFGLLTLLTLLGLTLSQTFPATAQGNIITGSTLSASQTNVGNYGAIDSPDDVIVRVSPGCTLSQVLRSCGGASLHNSLPLYRLAMLHPSPSSTRDRLVQQLRINPFVTHIEPNNPVRLPIGTQIHHVLGFDGGHGNGSNVYQNLTVNKQINYTAATDLTSGAGIVVAVLDTGVDIHHSDLQSSLMGGFNFISPNLLPDDIADGLGDNPAYGHGTMVAGIIHRIAPDATIMPLRVLNGDGTGTLSDVLAALAYAVQSGAKIINLSLGTYEYSQFLEEAIQDAQAKGVLIVASAGNNSTNAPHYPAAYAGVQSVTSVEENYAKSGFGNYGSWVRFVAPGDGIASDFPGSTTAVGEGTSFAAPFVSGAAALLLSLNTNPDVNIIDVLHYSARPVDPYNSPWLAGQLGYGVIDIGTGISWLPLQ